VVDAKRGNSIEREAKKQAAQRMPDEPNGSAAALERAKERGEPPNDPRQGLEGRRVGKEPRVMSGPPQR
jgi:hypothetical protein